MENKDLGPAQGQTVQPILKARLDVIHLPEQVVVHAAELDHLGKPVRQQP
jgi:hypothetical protein